MREQTTLPHTYTFIGRPWNPVTQKGNYDTDRGTIDTIFLHTMAGYVAGTTAHFSNPNVVPSAHYGVGFDGKIIQWLPENVNAYHAGVYSWNKRSIGIEHEDKANINIVRPDALYEASSQLVADICVTYGIPLDRVHIKKHSDVKATSCPGTLDVDRIIARSKAILTSPPQEEQLVSHMLKPSVFAALVTQSTEYDYVWEALKLPPEAKTSPGSGKLIVDLINKNQSSMWDTNVGDILKQLLAAVRGGGNK